MKPPLLRADAPSLPSLFGRYTAVLADHDALHQVLAQLREMSRIGASGQEFPPELRPDVLLFCLENVLTEHFAREESIQYFGTLEAASPALAQTIAKLRTEHEAILHATSRLIALSRDEARLYGLSTATLGLLEWLERHEREENRLMTDFLSEAPPEDNDSDGGGPV